MRLATVVLILLNCFFFTFNLSAQTDYTGYIVTLEGDTLFGNIRGDKDVFSEVRFITPSAKLRKYTASEIKGYSVKYSQARVSSYYKSMQIENIGKIFVQQHFSNENIKFYYSWYKKEGEKFGKPVSIYIIDDKIYKVFYPNLSPIITYDEWLEGGVKLSEKDTLQGFIFIPGFRGLGEKKVNFRPKNSTKVTTYKYSEINGFFCKDFAYGKIDIAESDDKEKERMICEIINGEPMQLYVEEIQKGARVQGMGNVYYVPQFYIKNKKSDKVLVFPRKRPLTKEEDIANIKEWFKDYPALAESIISSDILGENDIVNIYNIYYALQNKQ